MNYYKRFGSKAIMILLSLIMVISCGFMAYAADDNGTAKNAEKLTLGKKTTITFDSEFNERYYKITIPSKGDYKMYTYSKADDSNRDFNFSVYPSVEDAVNQTNVLESKTGLINYWDSKTDYEYFTLDKGTYYICAQGWNEDQKTTGIKIVRTTNTYELNVYKSFLYKYETEYLGVWNIDDKEALITYAKSSDPKVIKINKEPRTVKGKKGYYVDCLAKGTGKATITLKYVTPKGKEYTIKRDMRVRKYPGMIKSLKVDGKTIDLTKNRFDYQAISKKTTASFKMTPKNGWKLYNVEIGVGKWNSDNRVLVKSPKTKLKKGTKFSFPKKYDYAYAEVDLAKGDEYVHYDIYLDRPQ